MSEITNLEQAIRALTVARAYPRRCRRDARLVRVVAVWLTVCSALALTALILL